LNPAAADTQNYILTDDNGTQRTPPNTVAFIVNNTLPLDRVYVARDTGTAGIINKDQFGGLDTPATTYNGLGDQEIRVAGDIDSEVPTSGYVRVIETTLQEEHHYVYDSRTTGTNGVFTLRTGANYTGTIGTASTDALIPAGSPIDFSSENVLVGMLVRNTTGGKTTHVWEVTSVGVGSPIDYSQLGVRQLYGPLDVTQDWDVNDTFEINRLIGDHTTPTDYAVTDNVHDLILDLEATGTSEQNTFVKTIASDFGVVVNVRQGKVILPFTQNPTVGDSGASVTVVRTPDTIAT
jgi:hypothetical protein